MPVNFLTPTQRQDYGRYASSPSQDDLARFFHLSDNDQALVRIRRGDHNRLGFALQLTTVRFLGTFMEDQGDVPLTVLQTLGRQLAITDPLSCIQEYGESRQYRMHAAEIRELFGYREFTDRIAGFRLARWLCALCWTGSDRPGILFDRATAWMLTHKVLLPGASVLERFVARVRSRMEQRLWHFLKRGTTPGQRANLEALLTVPEGSRISLLERLRSGPDRVSSRALVSSIRRLQSIRDLGIAIPAAAHVPPSRLAALARFAMKSKVSAISQAACIAPIGHTGRVCALPGILCP